LPASTTGYTRFTRILRNTTEMTTTCKVCIVGGGNLGKTSYLYRLLGVPRRGMYAPTLGVEVHPLEVHTNKGIYNLNFWDVAGNKKYGGMYGGYMLQAQGALLFRDGTILDSKWEEDAVQFSPNVKIVHVQNKKDLDTPTIENCYAFSAIQSDKKELYRPIVHLLRKITGLQDLKITKL